VLVHLLEVLDSSGSRCDCKMQTIDKRSSAESTVVINFIVVLKGRELLMVLGKGNDSALTCFKDRSLSNVRKSPRRVNKQTN